MTLEELVRDHAEEVIIKLRAGVIRASSSIDLSLPNVSKIIGSADALMKDNEVTDCSFGFLDPPH